MRLALASVIVIAAMTSAPVLAQVAGPTPTMATDTAVAVDPNAAYVPPPAPVPATATFITPPGWQGLPPEEMAKIVPAVPEPEPVELPPTPNDPMTLQVLQVLDRVCKPMIAGNADIEALAKPLGFRERRDRWELKVDRYEIIRLRPPTAANANVCFVDLETAIDGDKLITVGLHNWAVTKGYKLYRNDKFTTDMQRHTRSWELNNDETQAALVFVTTRQTDGSPVERRSDQASLMYSLQ